MGLNKAFLYGSHTDLVKGHTEESPGRWKSMLAKNSLLPQRHLRPPRESTLLWGWTFYQRWFTDQSAWAQKTGWERKSWPWHLVRKSLITSVIFWERSKWNSGNNLRVIIQFWDSRIDCLLNYLGSFTKCLCWVPFPETLVSLTLVFKIMMSHISRF